MSAGTQMSQAATVTAAREILLRRLSSRHVSRTLLCLAGHRLSVVVFSKDLDMLKLPIGCRRVLSALVIGICLAPLAVAAQPREIGTGKQLFIRF